MKLLFAIVLSLGAVATFTNAESDDCANVGESLSQLETSVRDAITGYNVDLVSQLLAAALNILRKITVGSLPKAIPAEIPEADATGCGVVDTAKLFSSITTNLLEDFPPLCEAIKTPLESTVNIVKSIGEILGGV